MAVAGFLSHSLNCSLPYIHIIGINVSSASLNKTFLSTSFPHVPATLKFILLYNEYLTIPRHEKQICYWVSDKGMNINNNNNCNNNNNNNASSIYYLVLLVKFSGW